MATGFCNFFSQVPRPHPQSIQPIFLPHRQECPCHSLHHWDNSKYFLFLLGQLMLQGFLLEEELSILLAQLLSRSLKEMDFSDPESLIIRSQMNKRIPARQMQPTWLLCMTRMKLTILQ